MAGGFKTIDLKKGKQSLSPKSVGKITQEPYSYEHRITLDQDALSKLGIDTPKVGDKYHVLGHAEVKSVSQNDQPGESTKRAELQFKRLGMKKATGGSGNGLFGAVSDGIKQAQED